MNLKGLSIVAMLFCFCFIACKNENSPKVVIEKDDMEAFNEEKKAILTVLNEETIAAFSRDYESWQDKWVHEDFVTKTYMQFPDSTITETLGWKEIDQFVRTYFKEHPEPDPFPTALKDIKVRLYKNGAWITYEQKDPVRGLKRETRLMEKVDNEWKIAGMHTTIYGSKNVE